MKSVMALAALLSMTVAQGVEEAGIAPANELSPRKWPGDPKVETYVEKARQAGFRVKVDKEKTSELKLSLVARDGAAIYQWKGHQFSSFVFADGKLLIADYSPYSTGVTVVAVEIPAGKVVWRAILPQAPVVHGKFYNRVNLSYGFGKLNVLSHQSMQRGNLFWSVDVKTGAVLESEASVQ